MRSLLQEICFLQAGSTLFAQLEIWKAARQESEVGGGGWGTAPSVSTLSSTEEASEGENFI